jgi:chromate transport protein ChrA
LHGTRGGLVAGSFFIIPSVFALLLATTSFVLLQRFKVSIYLTVLADAVAGMV